MVSLRLYLDTRAVKRGEPAPLKVVFTKKGVAAWLSLGIRLLPSQWDRDRQRVVGHPQKDAYNSFLLNRMAVIQNLVLSLTSSGDLAGLSSLQVKDKVAALLDPESGSENLFVARFEAYGSRQKALRTREIYATTLKKILAFDHKARSLSFSDVNKDWLSRFDAWLVPSCPSKNGSNIHLRNIRAVFNDAIDNEVTSAYPFRRFKIRPAATVKRAVSVETLRAIFDYPVEPWQRRYVDAFRLVFCLIGINVVDLLDAAPLVDGRLAYLRSKTGRLYDIKVEPEAFYEACDRLGMLVIQDMVNAGPYNYILDTVLPNLGVKRRPDVWPGDQTRKTFFEQHCLDTQDRLRNHPCVIAYTIFNEGWGQYDTSRIYRQLKAHDPSRLYISASGWFKGYETDIDSEHIYFRETVLSRENRPLLLSECGGYTYDAQPRDSGQDVYGYGKTSSPEELTDRICQLYRGMVYPSIERGLNGVIYTQLTDVENEINGLYTYDRTRCKAIAGRMKALAEEACRRFREHTSYYSQVKLTKDCH